MISKLAEAISLAALAHDGQLDKSGEPYILHCLRVMLAQTTDEARIVGVLHDLLEDTRWAAGGLRALGFSDEIVQAIEVLTRSEGEPYYGYLERVIGNELALAVKRADVRDNLRPLADELRSSSNSKKYAHALEVLGKAA